LKGIIIMQNMNNYILLKEENGKTIEVAILHAPSYDIADAAMHQAVDVMDWDKYAVDELRESLTTVLPEYTIMGDLGGVAYIDGQIVTYKNLVA